MPVAPWLMNRLGSSVAMHPTHGLSKCFERIDHCLDLGGVCLNQGAAPAWTVTSVPAAPTSNVGLIRRIWVVSRMIWSATQVLKQASGGQPVSSPLEARDLKSPDSLVRTWGLALVSR